MANPQKGVVGLDIIVTCVDQAAQTINVSVYDIKEIKLEKPDFVTVITKTATQIGDGSAGQIKYRTVLNDIDQSGMWQLQAHLHKNSDNSDYLSAMINFPVEKNAGE